MDPITVAIVAGVMALGRWYNARTERELKERKEQEEAQKRASEEAQQRMRKEQFARLVQLIEQYSKREARPLKISVESKSLHYKKNMKGIDLIKSQCTNRNEVDEFVLGKIIPSDQLPMNLRKMLKRRNG